MPDIPQLEHGASAAPLVAYATQANSVETDYKRILKKNRKVYLKGIVRGYQQRQNLP